MTGAPLKNPKWEAFCQYVAHGSTASEAYRKAGYRSRGASAHSAASRLLKRADIQQRVEEIRD